MSAVKTRKSGSHTPKRRSASRGGTLVGGKPVKKGDLFVSRRSTITAEVVGFRKNAADPDGPRLILLQSYYEDTKRLTSLQSLAKNYTRKEDFGRFGV